MKHCYRCKTWLPDVAFYADKRRKDGKQARCKSCNVMVTHGISRVEYESMAFSQNYRCAICGSTESRKGKLHAFQVDHDHITGLIRGLLCFECNIGLGKFKDKPALLERAAEYLRAN